MATTRAYGVAKGLFSYTILFHILSPVNLAPPCCPVYYRNCVLYICSSIHLRVATLWVACKNSPK